MNDFTKEQMLAAYRALPEVIKDALSDPQNDEVMAELQKSLQLHIDTIALINRETSCLLLGLINPTQYADRLRAKAGLTEPIAATVIAEINKKIFVPLREKMRAGATGEAVTQTTVDSGQAVLTPQAPAAGTIQHAPLISPSAPLQTKPTMSTPMTAKVLNRLAPREPASSPIVQQSAATQPPVPKPQPPTTATTNVVRPVSSAPTSLGAALAAAGVPKPNSAAPQIPPTTPAQQPKPMPEQKPIMSPQEKSLPLPPSDMFLSDHEEIPTQAAKPINQFSARPAPPPAPIPKPAPIPPKAPPIISAQPKPAAPAIPLVKEYTVDPYREQPEEHEK